MWQYIPYTLYNLEGKNGGFYNIRKICSFNCHIMIIIGARGTGKTFSVKELLLNQFLKNGKKFAWVRDTVDAKKELCNNDGSKFFEDFSLMKNKEFVNGSIKKSEFFINDINAGCCLPASVFQRYKGNSFQEINTIVYDEFIKEKGRITNKNNLWATLNTFSTIARSREDVKIFMLGNALDKSDDFLQFIGVDIKEFGFYINRNKSICLHYADNTANFNELNSKGLIGKLIVDSAYSDNLLSSKFLDTSNLIFDKLPNKAKLLFIVETPLQSARFYEAGGKLYVTEDVNPETYRNKRYVIDIVHASPTKPPLSLLHKKAIKQNIDKSNIFFKNQYLHKFILDIM